RYRRGGRLRGGSIAERDDVAEPARVCLKLEELDPPVMRARRGLQGRRAVRGAQLREPAGERRRYARARRRQTIRRRLHGDRRCAARVREREVADIRSALCENNRVAWL